MKRQSMIQTMLYIFQESLMRYNALIYMDSSIRITCSFFVKNMSVAIGKSGFCTPLFTGFSMASTTHPDMYKYIAVRDKFAQQYCACLLGIINTKDIFNGVLKWWLRCSLNRACMAPKGSRQNCHFSTGKDRLLKYAHCHRYDQAALGLLLNYHLKNDTNYNCAGICSKKVPKNTLTEEHKLHFCSKNISLNNFAGIN